MARRSPETALFFERSLGLGGWESQVDAEVYYNPGKRKISLGVSVTGQQWHAKMYLGYRCHGEHNDQWHLGPSQPSI